MSDNHLNDIGSNKISHFLLHNLYLIYIDFMVEYVKKKNIEYIKVFKHKNKKNLETHIYVGDFFSSPSTCM